MVWTKVCIFRYSGGGYTVAQLMMTEVTGVPFPDFMQRGYADRFSA